MKFKIFRYTKQKDGETKNYAILALEEDDQYLEGIDISKISKEEVLEMVKIVSEYERDIASMQKEALVEKKEFSEMISDPEYKEINEKYKENMKPFIKKAYRKFLVSNISEYEYNPGNQE